MRVSFNAQLPALGCNVMRIDKQKLADYLRGCALNYVFELPELENKDMFDLMADQVQAFLKNDE